MWESQGAWESATMHVEITMVSRRGREKMISEDIGISKENKIGYTRACLVDSWLDIA
jgi:hypothetical protein